MAIFEKIECTIKIDGEPLPEYDLPEGDNILTDITANLQGPKIAKYVESQCEKNFAIHFDLRRGFRFKECNALDCSIQLDDNSPSRTIVMMEDASKNGTISTFKDGISSYANGQTYLHKYRFRALMSDETRSRQSLKAKANLPLLGAIQISLYRAKAISIPNKRNKRKVLVPKVSETSVKGRALDAATTLNAPVQIGTSTTRRKIESRVDEIPLITFIFLYRGTDILRQIGILEQPLHLRPLEDRDPATLTPEEMMELIRRQNEIIRQQEENEKFMKKRARQAEAQRTLMTLDALKRGRNPSPSDNNDDTGDEDVQIVKKARKDRNIAIIELD